MESTYFRRGFGLKGEIEAQRSADYLLGECGEEASEAR